MKAKITCNYSDEVRDKLLPDLIPVLRARVKKEIDLSVQEFNKSPGPGFCHHAQVFDSGYTIDGAPVMVFLKMVVESGTLRTKIACHLGAEKSVQAKQDYYQNCMKEMGATSFKEPFFVSLGFFPFQMIPIQLTANQEFELRLALASENLTALDADTAAHLCWIISVGEIPPGKLLARTCANDKCVSLQHLILVDG